MRATGKPAAFFFGIEGFQRKESGGARISERTITSRAVSGVFSFAAHRWESATSGFVAAGKGRNVARRDSGSEKPITASEIGEDLAPGNPVTTGEGEVFVGAWMITGSRVGMGTRTGLGRAADFVTGAGRTGGWLCFTG